MSDRKTPADVVAALERKEGDFEGWDLSGEDLSSLDLSWAILTGAVLAGTVLTGADVSTTPGRRVLNAAERLTDRGAFTYGHPRGDDAPIPTCGGCEVAGGGTIEHQPDCAVQELIAAVRALESGGRTHDR